MNQPKTRHILLLDDEQSVAFALKLLLEALGFQVTDFIDGESALNYLKSNPKPDLIICDLRMPGMNGLQVLEGSKSIAPDLDFVLMSAHAQDHEMKKAQALGINGFISKPFTPDQLLEVLSKLEARREHSNR